MCIEELSRPDLRNIPVFDVKRCDPEETEVREIMTEVRNSIPAEMKLEDAVTEFIESSVAAILVVEEGRSIGL